MKRLRVLRSHTAHFRFLAECRDSVSTEFGVVGWIPRSDIRTPYSSGPTWPVYSWKRGFDVVVLETSHRRYSVFHVFQEVYATEAQAEAVYMAIRNA